MTAPPTIRPYSLSAIVLIFSVPALGGFLFGFDISTTSYTVVQLRAALVHHSSTVIGLVVSASSIGAFLGSLRIFSVADRIGRRAELRYGAVLYIVGAVTEVLAGFCFSATSSIELSMAVLISGRLIFGMGIACAMHGGPTYIAEMAPSQIRGLLVSLKEALIVLGILAGYVVGYLFSSVENGWMYAYGSSLVASFTMLILSFTIPPSYRWLLLQNREAEALQSVRFLFLNDSQAVEELESTKQQANASGAESEFPRTIIDDRQPLALPDATPSVWDIRYRAPMVAGIGLVILQQITGQPSVLSYATPFFADAGLSDWSSILVAAFKLCATLVSASSVEKYGRKNLLFLGNGIMLAALLVLAVSFGAASASIKTVTLLAMFAYIGGYQLSFGPISWLMISECFPLSVRGQAVALAVQMNFLFNAVVQFAVPVLEDLIGLNTMFFIFALLTAYSICFVKACVPETKGLTLEQIEEQFSVMRRARRRSAISLETVALLEET